MEKIDLHIHTNLSDGDYSLDEIINISKQNHCNKIAITDHEIINNYSAYCINNNFDIVNGVEFNTSEKGMHILGYGILNMAPIRKTLYDLHKENEEVTIALIEKLANRGFRISKDEIINFLNKQGFKYDFLDKRHVVKYLINSGYTKDVPSTYKNLIGKGTDLYLPLKKIKYTAILDLISGCGGVSVLAHPDTLGISQKEFLVKIKELIDRGLDGIEIFNGNLYNVNFNFYKYIAKELNILYTVGSDFHSLNNQKIGVECDDDVYYSLIEKINYKNKLLKK